MHKSTGNPATRTVLLMVLAMSAPAYATPLYTVVFDANCTDCALAGGTDRHAVSITLALQNYTPGDELRRDNFLSFSYENSNLVENFTIDRNLWVSGTPQTLSGVIPESYVVGDAFEFHLNLRVPDANLWSCTELGWSTATPENACRKNDFVTFRMASTGDWQVGTPAKDVGNLNLVVPEPSAIALLGLGLAAFGARRMTAR